MKLRLSLLDAALWSQSGLYRHNSTRTIRAARNGAGYSTGAVLRPETTPGAANESYMQAAAEGKGPTAAAVIRGGCTGGCSRFLIRRPLLSAVKIRCVRSGRRRGERGACRSPLGAHGQ